jgi:hypothetical protein
VTPKTLQGGAAAPPSQTAKALTVVVSLPVWKPAA